MSTRKSPTPIAIVGIATLFPKAQNLAEYWANIASARDCITDVPEDFSWSPKDFHDDDHSVQDTTWATRGGYLEKVPFDPMEWGVPPSQLESIDTTQLLSLIVAREAMKDAGLDPNGSDWNKDRTGVILGVTGTQEMAVVAGSRLRGPQWRSALKRHGITGDLQDSIVDDIGKHLPTWTEQTFPGLLGNVVAGRITNRFDLGGPNCVVDAACASSLAAMDFALSQLEAGKADIMLSGGVDALNDIFMHMCFSRTPALSQSNNATPFDADADGILLGEGLSILVLKRLDDAERDQDRIYATIRSIGASSDGRNKSIYAPDSGGQAKALRRAYEQVEFGLEDVELIEAHGTGTKVGDAVEFAGLKAIFNEVGAAPRSVALGSVKSQIGHAKSAAGVAGIVKAALALHQRVLPPTAKVDTPNPKLGIEDSALYINTDARPWVRGDDHPRRAGVNSFGFGGSNFHVVLEEYGDADVVQPLHPAQTELFLFAAESAAALSKLLVDSDQATLARAAHAVLSAWTPGPHVVSFTADTMAQLQDRLAIARELVLDAPAAKNGVTYAVPTDADRKLAVLFPGQGSQYVAMGRTLGLRHAAARAALDRADSHFAKAGRERLSPRIFPPSAFDSNTEAAQQQALTATEWAQPAIGAVSVGMWRVLSSFGIKPDAFAGHSYGELVALHAAGVLTEDGLFTASRIRGEAMADKGSDRGTMAAVSASLADIEAVLEPLNDGVVLANRNHPRQGVISGSKTGIDTALQAMSKAGLTGRKIPVSAAFHSPLVADARKPFEAALKKVAFKAPDTPVYANATAKTYGRGKASQRKLLASQITSPVDFVGIIGAMTDSGIRTFVECGPKGVLTGLAKKCTRGVEGVSTLSMDGKAGRTDGDTQLKTLLAALASRGIALDVTPLLLAPLPPARLEAGSKATTWINGANVLNDSTRNPPMHSGPTVDTLVAQPAAAAVPNRRSPAPNPPAAAAPPLAAAAPKHRVPAPNPTRTSKMDPTTLAELLETTRASLDAFQRAQERTALVHQEFLRAHVKATENFKELFQTHARLVELAGGLPVGAALPSPAIAAPAPLPTLAPLPALPTAVAAPTVMAPPAPATPAPTSFASTLPKHGVPTVSITGRGTSGAIVLGGTKGTELPPLLDAAQMSGAGSYGPSAAPSNGSGRAVTIAASGAVSRESIVSAMLESVSAKTGYPMDMLELSMDLESDLGIDSIKRVEILAGVQEEVPSLPELDNDKMSALRTVADVIDYLEGTLPSAPPALVLTGQPANGAGTNGVGRDTIVASMLSVVAAKTGYPKDMLELSMDLESDLGIDSIKRVEILAAVQEDVPSLPELDNDKMSALRTLDEVVGYLEGMLPGGNPLPFDLSAEPTPAQRIDVVAAPTRRIPVVVPAPAGRPVSFSGPLAVTRDLHGHAANLAQALQRRKVEAVVVDPDWSNPDSIASALPAHVAGIVHLGALGTPAKLRERVIGAFHLARLAGPLPLFATVSGQGGRFGIDRRPKGECLFEGGLAGLPKTLAHEWDDSRLLAIDVDPDDVDIEALANELLLQTDAVEIGLAQERITVGVIEAALPQDCTHYPPVAPGELIVVSGGARGVTAAVVIEMARRWKPSFLLLGRSAVPERDAAWARDVADDSLKAAAVAHLRDAGAKPTPKAVDALVWPILSAREVRANLTAIRDSGSAVRYRSADVRSREAIEHEVNEAVSAHGSVRMIVHGAGVIADKLTIEKSPDAFNRVFDTKVDGLLALLDSVDVSALKAVAMFSSVAGRYGNRGQCDYSMANEVLTRAARNLADEGMVVKSLDWGPWAGGMVDPGLERQFRKQGVQLIDLAAGARFFCDELEVGSDDIEVVVGGPDVPDTVAPMRTGSVTHRLEPVDGDYLSSHLIKGQRVLPAAMVLEWVATAARKACPDLRIRGVRDLQILNGVTVTSPVDLTLRWTEEDAYSGAQRTLSFVLTGQASKLGPMVHYRAHVDLIARSIEPTPFGGSNGLGRDAYPYAIEEAYRRFLFHGPLLRGISAVSGISDEGIVGTLIASEPGGLGVRGDAWSTDPLVVDSTIQLVLLWVREKAGAAALPSALGEYRQYAPMAGHLTCHVEIMAAQQNAGTFSATLVDARNRVVATLTDARYTATPSLNEHFRGPVEAPNSER